MKASSFSLKPQWKYIFRRKCRLFARILTENNYRGSYFPPDNIYFQSTPNNIISEFMRRHSEFINKNPQRRVSYWGLANGAFETHRSVNDSEFPDYCPLTHTLRKSNHAFQSFLIMAEGLSLPGDSFETWLDARSSVAICNFLKWAREESYAHFLHQYRCV